VKLGHAIGEVNVDAYKRVQIRKTIDEHLRKELRLRPKGLKVLSLFFIDKVANYRAYDADGNPCLGKYAVMFEEEYAKAIRSSDYVSLFEGVDLETAAEGVHNGYFAIDKKKDASGAERFKDSKGDGNTEADGSAYQLIMRDKERLLSFESKLKFIFSHSALREGWDNPNVFQICTLNETASVMKKRQEIGRGLRIAVNQDGERVRNEGVNVLTVMANESYKEFATKLQKEIEQDTGIRFNLVEKHLFAAVKLVDESGAVKPLGTEGSDALWNHLKAQGYIDSKGKVTDTLRTALKANNVVLPEERVPQTTQIVALLKKVAGGLQIKNVADRTQVRLNKERFLSDDFKALWDQIKYRTTFMVDFDVAQLITECAEAIKKNVNVPKARYVYTVAAADITRAGVDMEKKRSQTQVFEQENLTPPDILSVLQNDTNLTRKSLVAILRKAGNLFAFKRNPTKYIEQVTKIIKAKMQTFIVDGIKYHRLGDNEFYGQELFKDEELFGYLERDMVEGNMVEAKDRSIYEHVVCDSKVERGFAEGLNTSEEVKVFAKLPSWFKIDTPLGSYNPDWVVLVKKADGQEERLFFVVETKGEVMFDEALRPTEVAKIKCGEAHFKALGTNVVFEKASSYDAFMGTIG
jgi:type III restriction enzyme